MSVTYYDESLTNKINRWINVPNMRVLRPNETSDLFSMQADIKEDKPLTLPLIALSRNSDIDLSYPHKKPSSFDGLMLEALGEISEEWKEELLQHPERHPNWKVKKGTIKDTYTYSVQLNAIPMTVRYQLDIYTRYAEEGNDIMRGLVFNFVNDPIGTIEIPYQGLHLAHNYTVYLDSTVSDNSDIPQRLFNDQFTRWTIGLTIQHAYLFDVKKYPLLTAEIELYTDD